MINNDSESTISVQELKKTNPWINQFSLSDEEFLAVSDIMASVIVGEIPLADFLPRLDKAILKSADIKKQLALAIAKNRLWRFRESLGDVAGLIKSLGGAIPETAVDSVKANANEAPAKLASNEVKSSPTGNLPMAPKKTSTTPAKMAFSMSDEKEFSQIVVPDGGINKDWPSQAQGIIIRFGFADSDQVLAKRLENIIVSYLKDIRDEMETVDSLSRARKVGGMELSKDEADRLMRLIKEQEFLNDKNRVFKNNLSQQDFLSSVSSSNNNQSTADISQNQPTDRAIENPSATVKQNIPASNLNLPKPNQSFAKTAFSPSKSMPKIEMEDGLPVITMPDDLIVPQDDMIVKPEIFPFDKLEEKEFHNRLKSLASNDKMNGVKSLPIQQNSQPGIKINIQSDVSPAQPADNLPPPSPPPFMTTKQMPDTPVVKNPSKPTMDGLKFEKKLTGPVEELATLTLIEFRRLSDDPKIATSKVKEKIELIGQDGFGKKIEAIDAWNKNEISRFYRLLGQTAMADGQPVENVIKERLVSGKPTLSLPEFEAVMELNRGLRF